MSGGKKRICTQCREREVLYQGFLRCVGCLEANYRKTRAKQEEGEGGE